MCTAEAEKGTDQELIHEVVGLSSVAELRLPAISKGLGIPTFKSLKWRNCPTTVRKEHVIRVYLGLVKYSHPLSSVESPFSFLQREFLTKKNGQVYCEWLVCNN